ncbi:unnamed protein product (macronuclear) [Paramecium tetraurelia]|uniref:Uncharacterized protein n=1 Tax=Paramecium tetraurelia TaxID=5888 RepID=A0BHT5_PARTE|nr:uncharacterized protein GSPATT00029138001 [Paramecium tetraurelia]CAK58102.1 unnamed protein product [Paramecium tetraurelia]|eukprot:XP_001425500.1 hypothetical protein (macronuclear) [Paramecium tetraurelia strain d4-2]
MKQMTLSNQQQDEKDQMTQDCEFLIYIDIWHQKHIGYYNVITQNHFEKLTVRITRDDQLQLKRIW